MGIGYPSQEASAFRKLTVEDNIMAILELQLLSNPSKDRLEELIREGWRRSSPTATC